MENMDLYNRVRSVPEEAQRKITGGTLKGKTDINPMWRIKTLTKNFGPCGYGWYYTIKNLWTDAVGEEMAVFVQIELFVKYDGEWSMPITGIGGNMLAAMGKNGLYVSDECYKMAVTDAISVACKQLGIAADIYFSGDPESKYFRYTEKDGYGDEDSVSHSRPEKAKMEAQSDDRLSPVYDELRRIGYSPKAVCATYNLADISDISNLEIKDFLTKAKKLPTKSA